ncbi:hypothetical protein [Paenibacillus sp. PL91]|uniref:hypothetical protein n=1 Tax=Paenibacillus sp. PL91 TaxID=2729538 RepID=UPI00145C8125|nr:hypothetical protein [Paenibacillus sp. PL91]MBC9203657.1 hypothetical protein [Paenibacillus sp. PL91]
MAVLQTNSIWITESRRQLESLDKLQPMLRFKKAVLNEECDITELPSYDMVYFFINPAQIGNAFFIKAVKKVLEVRKNSKTLFIAVDNSHLLSDEDLYKVELELKRSLSYLLSNPVIFTVSSYYAALHRQYVDGKLTLEELRQNREIVVKEKDGALVTGKQLQAHHAELLLELSRMEKLYRLVQEVAKGLKETGIDVSRSNWLVTGPPSTGKSQIARLLQTLQGEAFHVTDAAPERKDLGSYYDKLIIVLDMEAMRDEAYMEYIFSKHATMDKIVIANKIDEFMFYQSSRKQFELEALDILKGYTSERVYFVSAYYYEQFLQLDRGETTREAIIQNPDIVLADAIGLPISKERNKAKLAELLFNHSGFNQLSQLQE